MGRKYGEQVSFILFLIALILFVVAAIKYSLSNYVDAPLFSIIILALPGAFYFSSYLILRRAKNTVEKYLSIVFFLGYFFILGFWFEYISKDNYRSYMSFLAIIIVLILVIISGIFAILINKCRNGDYDLTAYSWKNDLVEPTFANIMFFMSIFLNIAILLSFAFAFNDKNLINSKEKTYGLYSESIRAEENIDSDSSEESGDSPKKAEKENVFKIKYGGCETCCEIDIDYILDKKDWKKTRGEYKKKITNIEEKNKKIFRFQDNNEVLKKLIKKIFVQFNKGENECIHLKLLGHTSPDDPKGCNLKANFDIAQARVNNIQWQISELIEKYQSEAKLKDSSGKENNCELNGKSLNLFFSPYAVNEENFVLDLPVLEKEKIEEMRCVEIILDHLPNHPTNKMLKYLKGLYKTPRDLDLIDYLYFTFYTITTTGYGDIIPVSSQAKFIATIANLCEVFFIVIFFNILLANPGKNDKNESNCKDEINGNSGNGTKESNNDPCQDIEIQM